MHQRRTDHAAVAFRRRNRDHALGVAGVARVFRDRRALAVAVFAGRQYQLVVVFGH